MNIGFDFDDTLNTDIGIRLCKNIKPNNTIFIISSRLTGNNKDIFALADELGIDRANIFLTNGQSKVSFINNLAIDIFFEDCPFEIKEINKETNANVIDMSKNVKE